MAEKYAGGLSVAQIAAEPEFSGASGTIADGSIGSVKLGGDVTAAGKAMLTAANASAQAALISAFISGGGLVNGQRVQFVRCTPGEIINTKLTDAATAVGLNGIVCLVDSEGVINGSGVALSCNQFVPLVGRPRIYTTVNNGSPTIAMLGRRGGDPDDDTRIGPFYIRRDPSLSTNPNTIGVQLGDTPYRWAKRNTAYQAGDLLAYDFATDLIMRALNNGTTAASVPALTSAPGTQTDGTLQVEFVADKSTYQVGGRVNQLDADLKIHGVRRGFYAFGWEIKASLNIRECDISHIISVGNATEWHIKQRNNAGFFVDCQAMSISHWTAQSNTGQPAPNEFDGCLSTEIGGVYWEVTGSATPGPVMRVGDSLLCRGTSINSAFWGQSFTPANPPISLVRNKGFRGRGPGNPFAAAGQFAAPLQTGTSTDYSWDAFGWT